MRRAAALTLTLALLLGLLSGCYRANQETEGQGVELFYRSAEDSYTSPTGVLASERRVLTPKARTLEEFLSLYLQGPQSESLVSPFPKELHVISAREEGDGVRVILDDSFAALGTAGMSVAAACLARTLYAYRGFETVTLQAQTARLGGQKELVIRPEQLVLNDDSGNQPSTTVRLYFADGQNRYLVAEERTQTAEHSSLPEAVLQGLIAGPQGSGLQPTIPEGTILLGASVSDGVCVVNFSAEFLSNRPDNELAERMTVFSVVDSLTELEDVSSVEILVEGNEVDRYCYLSLAQELTRDDTLIGPVRAGLGEFDSTIYVCLAGDNRLAAAPMRLQEQANESRAETVLRALIDFAPRNGYYSPLGADTIVRSISESGGVCTVDFNAELLDSCEDDEQRALLLRSIIATLTSVDTVRIVVVSAGGVLLSARDYAGQLDKDWFHEK